MDKEIKQAIDTERYELLSHVEAWLEIPVILLGFVWLILLFVELIWGLTPSLQFAIYVIWAVFLLDFSIRFILAPNKIVYLRRNWLTAISLVVPAFRVLRVVRIIRLLRLARAARGLQLLKVVSSLNRGMRDLQISFRKRGFIYVVVFSTIVIIIGAAGMYAFEAQFPSSHGFNTYWDSLWWTAMVLTTLGSEAWPRSPEGRMLGFLLSIYAFTVFGYVTATLASYFIGKDKEKEAEPAASAEDIRNLYNEIEALRRNLSEFNKK